MGDLSLMPCPIPLCSLLRYIALELRRHGVFLGFPNAVSGVSQRSFWGFPDRTLIKTDGSVVELSSKLLQMRGRRRGQNKAQAALPAVAAIPTSAAIPTADIPNAAAIPTTIPTTIPAAIPAAAAANATTLQNPVGDNFL
jgi:hypothetical protein